MARFLCFGEMLLRMSAPLNERLFQSDSLRTHFVGAEGNVANSLARFDNEAHLFTILPDNTVGRACRESLLPNGTKVDLIRFVEGRLGTYFFERGAMTRPSSITYDRARSAFAEYEFDQVDWRKMLAGFDWLHVCGITLALNDRTAAACIAAATAAREIGVKVSFDCNYRATLWEGRDRELRERSRAMVALADCLFAGRRDARYLLDQDLAQPHPSNGFAEVCAAYREKWPNLFHIASTYREIISPQHNIYTGRYCRDGEVFISRSQDMNGIVDRIGGGDAFAAGALHQIAADADGQQVIEFAIAAAALKHAVMGDTNLLTVTEVERALRGGAGDVRR